MLPIPQWLIMCLRQRVPGIIKHKIHQGYISPNSVLPGVSASVPIFISFLSSQHFSTRSLPHFTEWISRAQTLFHRSVRVTMTSLLHWESNMKIESALDFRSGNLWYIDLENSTLSLALKIGTPWVCPLF